MENTQQPTSDYNTNDVDDVFVICKSSSSSSEQVQTPTTTTLESKVVHQNRLYECNFCKKGFSNAQALGGHMNVHRKDKAILKQKASKSNHQARTTNIPLTLSSITADAGNNTHSKPSEFTSDGGQVRTSITSFATNKWLPYGSFSTHHPHRQQQLQREDQTVFYDSQVALADPQQLPLFVETASTTSGTTNIAAVLSDNDQINYFNDNPINHHQELHQHQYHHVDYELDLELRLGQKPPKETLDLGTRKFF